MAQVEALEFNRQWTVNMDEFEKRATQVADALRVRHEQALTEHVESQRAALHSKYSRRSKETLEAMRVQERLVRGGEYKAASKQGRRVQTLLRRDELASVLPSPYPNSHPHPSPNLHACDRHR